MRNSAGIHVRPSGLIGKEFEDYPGNISLRAHDMETDLSNVLGIISLGLQKGDQVSVRVEGPDDEAVCARLIELLEKEYDFPPRK